MKRMSAQGCYRAWCSSIGHGGIGHGSIGHGVAVGQGIGLAVLSSCTDSLLHKGVGEK